MTVKVTKPAINVREELADLRKPTGIAGEAMLRAETPQEQFQLIGAGRRNLLLNGDFSVSQRGVFTTATSVGGGNYYLDRWQLTTAVVTPTLTNAAVTLPNGQTVKSQKITATAAGSGYAQMRQKVETYEYLRGQWVTLSAWVRSNKGDVSGTGLAFYDNNGGGWEIGDSIPNDGNWHYVTHTFKVSDTISQYPEITIQHNNVWAVGEYIETALFQLELGKVATPFEHRSYGEELALCQRYYQDHTNEAVVRNLVPYTSNYAYTDSIIFPVTMRASPTITLSTAEYYNGAWRTPSSNLAYRNTIHGFNWEPQAGAGHPYTAWQPLLGKFRYTANAEL